MEMQKASDLLAEPGTTWNTYTGTCAEHGESTVKVPKLAKLARLQVWSCAKCESAKAEAESDAYWKADRAQTLQRIATIPEKYRGQRFEPHTDEQKAARFMVKSFRDVVVASRTWAVLVMVGTTGTGKTLMASELAQSLIEKEQISVRYCTCAQMISEIQGAYGKEGKSAETEVARFAHYDLLILDEIDAKRSTEDANLHLQEVINRRYNADRPVCVITNQAFADLRRYVGDRVDSRLHENAFVCEFTWPDFRKVAP